MRNKLIKKYKDKSREELWKLENRNGRKNNLSHQSNGKFASSIDPAIFLKSKYSTDHPGIATALMHAGFQLLSIRELEDHYGDPDRFIFTFKRKRGFKELVESFLSGTLQVTAETFFSYAEPLVGRSTPNIYTPDDQIKLYK